MTRPARWSFRRSTRSTRKFSEGLAAVQKDFRKWGYINKTGKIAIPLRYSSAFGFYEGLAAVAKKGFFNWKLGYIDKAGKMVIPPRYSRAEEFSDGLAQVVVGDKVGYIDKIGRMVIPPQFADGAGGNFFEGLDRVWVDDKMGYIDKTGKYVWAPTK